MKNSKKETESDKDLIIHGYLRIYIKAAISFSLQSFILQSVSDELLAQFNCWEVLIFIWMKHAEDKIDSICLQVLHYSTNSHLLGADMTNAISKFICDVTTQQYRNYISLLQILFHCF